MPRNVPNVNASLIREIRIIAQQLFGSGSPKVNNHYGMRAAEAQAKTQKPTALKCVFCTHLRVGNPNDAITVMNGQAVCVDHEYYVRGGEFNRIIALIRRDEKKE